jgi:hypothetical protein
MGFISDLQVNEEGAKRRRADFLALYYLRENGPSSQAELEQGVKSIADSLVEFKSDSPVHFTQSSGSNGTYSRELNEAIDRCLHYDRIERTTDNRYQLTDRGEEYLQSPDRLEGHGINTDFQDVVATRTTL